MIDCNKSPLNNLIRNFVTACTICFDQFLIGFGIIQEMAGETDIFVYAEMLITFEMAMTCAACDFYSIDRFAYVISVCEFNVVKVDIFCQQFLGTMTIRP